MSSTSDPPDGPAPPRGRRRGGPGLWPLAAFGVICVLAGYGVAEFAPRLTASIPHFPKTSPYRFTAPAPAHAPAETGSPAPPEPTPSIAQLNARVESLEAQQSAVRQAAAAALAAANLLDAAQSSRPFQRELQALKAVAPAGADLAALEKLAATGAPSRAALAVEFPLYAARAAAAAPRSGSRFASAVGAIAAKFVSLRRLDGPGGSSVDAILARAEQQMNDGDVDQALRLVDTLPPASRSAMDPWRALALDRAELDRRVSAIRLEAVESLARLSEGGA